VVAPLQQRQFPMNPSKTINALAVATTLAAVCGLYWFLHPRPPAIDRQLHTALGELLATEALKLAPPGARIIVIARDPLPFQVPASAAQLDGFLRTLKRSGQRVATFHRIQLDPLRQVAVPPGDFFELIRRAGDGDVIVSFLGPPVLDAGQLAKLGNQRPKILAVCTGALPARVDLRAIFGQRLLSGVVISRADAPAHAVSGNGARAFEQVFKWITPGDLTELPPFAGARS